jgi:hypothetical protein
VYRNDQFDIDEISVDSLFTRAGIQMKYLLKRSGFAKYGPTKSIFESVHKASHW